MSARRPQAVIPLRVEELETVELVCSVLGVDRNTLLPCEQARLRDLFHSIPYKDRQDVGLSQVRWRLVLKLLDALDRYEFDQLLSQDAYRACVQEASTQIRRRLDVLEGRVKVAER